MNVTGWMIFDLVRIIISVAGIMVIFMNGAAWLWLTLTGLTIIGLIISAMYGGTWSRYK